METKVRLNLELAPGLLTEVRDIATDSGTTVSEIVRVALALYRECYRAKKRGQFIGVVDDPARLDREFVGTVTWRFS